MAELRKCKVKAQDLRRLWYWVGNSSPNVNTYLSLRAASKALRAAFQLPDEAEEVPDIARDVEGFHECFFTELELAGFRESMLQAIAGTNHARREPAPFHSIEYLILPLAETLGIAREVKNSAPMLQGLVE